eukprot:6648189-Pyramimonas_sp.AAC.1
MQAKGASRELVRGKRQRHHRHRCGCHQMHIVPIDGKESPRESKWNAALAFTLLTIGHYRNRMYRPVNAGSTDYRKCVLLVQNPNQVNAPPALYTDSPTTPGGLRSLSTECRCHNGALLYLSRCYSRLIASMDAVPVRLLAPFTWRKRRCRGCPGGPTGTPTGPARAPPAPCPAVGAP